MNQHLNALGWCAHFENQLQSEDQSCIAGRIIEVQRELALLSDGQNEFWCGISGRMRFDAMNADAFPAVGDWALVRINAGDERGVIVQLLDRKSCFARKAPQTGAVQVVAANIDVAFITAALGVDFNLRRIERYLTLVWESGARPVVVLSKSDKCADLDAAIASTFADVEAIVASCRFSDCQHRTEPGCGVKRALDNGSLDRERWQSYQKLQKEAAYQARQDDPNLMRAERERWKKIGQIGRSNARWLWD